MQTSISFPQLATAGFIAAVGVLWDKLGWMLLMWGIAMGLDYLTGTLAALHSGEWNSNIAREGIWHKAGMIIVVLVAGLFDAALKLVTESAGIIMPFEFLALPIVLSWYIITELGSILENAIKMGAQRVPAWLRKGLAVAAEAVDKAGEKAVGENETEKGGGDEQGNG